MSSHGKCYLRNVRWCVQQGEGRGFLEELFLSRVSDQAVRSAHSTGSPAAAGCRWERGQRVSWRRHVNRSAFHPSRVNHKCSTWRQTKAAFEKARPLPWGEKCFLSASDQHATNKTTRLYFTNKLQWLVATWNVIMLHKCKNTRSAVMVVGDWDETWRVLSSSPRQNRKDVLVVGEGASEQGTNPP